MTPFQTVTAIAVPFDEPNVDTNQLCPTRFNKVPRGPRFADILFHDRRFTADGAKRPDFILNQEPYTKAGIIVADRNFGCGSSRETAVYALGEFGIRTVIAPSFGDIFSNNSFKNGLLPVILSTETCARLREQLQTKVGATLTVDLERQTVRDVEGAEHRFEVHALRKRSLLGGLDDVALTRTFAEPLSDFETGYRQQFPWLYGAGEARSPLG
jgi:3-isopropylmalate/(R)-2-methylmalate dehydratase small subunit